MTEKRCPRCKETKPITEFGKDKRNKNGLNVYCKTCKKKYNDEQREYRIEYYKRKPRFERCREYSKRYRKEHPDYRRKNNINRRARIKNSEGNTSTIEINECLLFFNYECAYSGVPLTEGHHLDHIIPISKGGSSDIHNLVPCLPTINLQKSIKDFDEWYPQQSFFSKERYDKIKEWMKKREE